MRRSTLLCCTALLFACAPADDDAEIPADTATMTPAPAQISLADVTGTWSVEAMPENSDSVIARYQLWAPEDTAQWKMKFDHQADTLPVRLVAIAGDSVHAVIGPYSSALRPGVMVTTNTVYRIENGQLIGRSIARYNVSTPDSVIVVRTRGTRQ